jgi:hypothetical protein
MATPVIRELPFCCSQLRTRSLCSCSSYSIASSRFRPTAGTAGRGKGSKGVTGAQSIAEAPILPSEDTVKCATFASRYGDRSTTTPPELTSTAVESPSVTSARLPSA